MKGLRRRARTEADPEAHAATPELRQRYASLTEQIKANTRNYQAAGDAAAQARLRAKAIALGQELLAPYREDMELNPQRRRELAKSVEHVERATAQIAQGQGSKPPSKYHFYVVNTGHGRATHIMEAKDPRTPNERSTGNLLLNLLTGWSQRSRYTLCGLIATRHVGVFSPGEVSCRECRRRWELATGQR